MNFKRLWKDELSIALNNSDTAVLFTAARRQQAINDAVEEFADLTECWTRYSTITCSCSVTEYALLSSGVLSGSTDYVRLAKTGAEFIRTSSAGVVTHLSGDDFPRRDLVLRNRTDPGWRQSTSLTLAPTGYYLRKNGGDIQLGLNEPLRIGSSETAKVLVPYVAQPAPMASSSVEPFTLNSTTRTDLRIYHKAFPHYAAYKLLPLIGDQQGSQAHLQTFLGYVTRYTSDERPKGGTQMQFARNYLRDARRQASPIAVTPSGFYTR